MAREIYKGLRKSGKSGYLKINGYGKQSSENVSYSVQEGKGYTFSCLSASPSSWGVTLKGKSLLPRATLKGKNLLPKFEVIHLAPLK